MTASETNPSSISPEVIRDFVIAGHGNLPKVQQMLAAEPALLNVVQDWGPGGTETALQAAAHVGSRPVAEFLLREGAPLDICTAAMLGRRSDVEAFLEADPDRIQAHGAHRISLLTHAVLSGDVALVQMLHDRGAGGDTTLALQMAVGRGDEAMTRWLLTNTKPEVTRPNMQGKTAIEIAREKGDEAMVALLREYGAAG